MRSSPRAYRALVSTNPRRYSMNCVRRRPRRPGALREPSLTFTVRALFSPPFRSPVSLSACSPRSASPLPFAITYLSDRNRPWNSHTILAGHRSHTSSPDGALHVSTLHTLTSSPRTTSRYAIQPSAYVSHVILLITPPLTHRVATDFREPRLITTTITSFSHRASILRSQSPPDLRLWLLASSFSLFPSVRSPRLVRRVRCEQQLGDPQVERRRHLEVLGRRGVDEHLAARPLDQHRVVGRGGDSLGSTSRASRSASVLNTCGV